MFKWLRKAGIICLYILSLFLFVGKSNLIELQPYGRTVIPFYCNEIQHIGIASTATAPTINYILNYTANYPVSFIFTSESNQNNSFLNPDSYVQALSVFNMTAFTDQRTDTLTNMYPNLCYIFINRANINIFIEYSIQLNCNPDPSGSNWFWAGIVLIIVVIIIIGIGVLNVYYARAKK